VADHDRLEGALRTLGRQLDVPPAPPAAEVAAAVRARLESRPVGQARRPVLRYAVVLLALLVGGVLIAVPDVRAAIVEFFRIGGVVVQQGPGPSPAPTPTLREQPVADLAEAERLTGVRASVPERLGPPDEILVIDRRVVSLAYRATAGRPAIRLDQFHGELEPYFVKFLLSEEQAREAAVDGTRGWWVRGPHEIVYVDASGRRQRESARLAAAALIWERGGLTFRLEGDLDLQRAVEIAESMPR
jgi:hypothetical protein